MPHFPGHEEDADTNDLLSGGELVACMLDPECAAKLVSNLGGDTGDTAVDRTTQTARDTFTRETVDEITNQIQRVFFAVPTPEEFLNDFGNAFSGFVANAAEAGLGGSDLQQLQDPRSGFMQQMLSEFMGEISQRAAKGEEIFELAGLGGEPEKVGDRPGQRVETETERTTRLETEAATRGTTRTITTPVDGVEGGAAGEEAGEPVTRTTTEAGGETGTTETEAERRSVFEETEEIFQRPNITPIFKFSPSNFLLQRFGGETAEGATPEEKRDRFLGRLSTELRTSAPKVRPRETSVAVSARRA